MQPDQLQTFICNAYLDDSGVMRRAQIRREHGAWTEFTIGEPTTTRPADGYITPALPVEFHCHGMHGADFSEFDSLDLDELNANARQEGILCVLCIFLAHHKLDHFLDFMRAYAEAGRQGRLTHLVGVGVEGPLLSSFGGTPEQGMWVPTRAEWQALARCGELGLKYLVLSPDAMVEGSYFADRFTDNRPGVEWAAGAMLEANVALALGHFHKRCPELSARCVESVLRVAKSVGAQRYGGALLTDHLFNDMPLKFRHAWRNPRERLHRAEELRDIHLERWTLDNLDEVAGEVPAVLMRAAADGYLTLCMNFDGEHVDLAVCRRVVELVGDQAVIAMTDRTDMNFLAGHKLQKKAGSTLWYQKWGIVAAGSHSIDQQMHNMRRIDLPEAAIWNMAALLPAHVLGMPAQPLDAALARCSYVTGTGERYYIEEQPSVVLS